MPSYDDRWRARLGGAWLVDLDALEADIVLSRFTLLRGHVRLLRKTPIRQPWRGSAQSMVNFPSRMNTGAGAGLINRSSCSSKPLQSFQSRVSFPNKRGRIPSASTGAFFMRRLLKNFCND